MQFNTVLKGVVVSVLFVCGVQPASAATRDLIDTLYSADFDSENENKKAFKLDGELGVLASTGNTNANSFKGAITSQHDTQNWSNQYLAEMIYKQSEVADDEGDGTHNEVTAQRFYGSAQFDYKLHSPDKRLFMFGDYEDDQFSGYDYQASIAAGWSQLLWHDANSEFRYSIGPGWGFAQLDTGENEDSLDGLIVRASMEYRYEWETGARVRQFISTEAGDENTKSRFETSLSANIIESLGLKLSFIMIHNSNGNDDNVSLSTETTVAVVYSFF